MNYNDVLLAAGAAKAEQARKLLESHRARLLRVIVDNEFACTVARAKRLLRDVDRYLAEPPLSMAIALGEWGSSARGRQIDDVERESATQRQINLQKLSEARRAA